MAQTLGLMQIVLRTDLDQFVGGMQRAASAVDQQSSRMSRSLQGAERDTRGLETTLRQFNGGNAFNALAISALRAENEISRLRSTMLLIPAAVGGVGLAAGSRALMQYADTATQVRNRIAVLTDSQAGRLEAEREIFEIAQRTRTSYAATAQLYSRTTQSAQNLGRTQAEVARFVETVAMTSQISGATTQEAQSGAIQLAQGLASNRLQGDELRSILENNVALAQLLARELAGGDIGRLREMGTQGLLTAQQVIDAVLRSSDRVRQQFGQTQATVENGFVVLNNAIVRYVGQLDQALGGSQAFFNLMQTLAQNLPTVATGLGIVAAAFAGIAAARAKARMDANTATMRGEALEARNAAEAQLASARARQAEAQQQAAAARAAADAAASSRTPALAIASRDTVAEYQRQTQQVLNLQSSLERNQEALTRLEERRAAAVERVGAAQVAANAAGVESTQRLVNARERLERVDGLIAARQSRIEEARQALPFAESRRLQAGEAVSASAEAERARFATVAAQAQRENANATLEVARAAQIAEQATQRHTAAMAPFAGVVNAARNSVMSLWSFLGGGWGVVFAAAAAAVAALGVAHANAAARAREQEEALARLPGAINRIAEAQRALQQGRPQQEGILQSQIDLRAARDARSAGLLNAIGSIGQAFQGQDLVNLLRGAGVDVTDLQTARGAGASGQNIQSAIALRERLRELFLEGRATADQIEALGLAVLTTGRGFGMADADVLALARSLNQLANQTRQIDELTRRTEAARAAQEALSPRTQTEQSLAENSVRQAEFNRQIQLYTDLLNRARTQAEAAAPAFRQVAQDMIGDSLTAGASGLDLAQRLGITSEATTAAAGLLQNLTELRQIAAGVPNEQLRGLVEQLGRGEINSTQFNERLADIARQDAAVDNVRSRFVDLSRGVGESRDVVARLQEAINALTGRTVDIVVRTTMVMNGQRTTGAQARQAEIDSMRELGLFQGERQAALDRRLERSRLTREQRRLAELRDQFPGASQEALAEIARNETQRQRSGSRWTPEQRVMRELADAVRVARGELTELDQEVIRYARSARIAESETEAYVSALQTGDFSGVSERLMRIRRELIAINEAQVRQRFENPNERFDRDWRNITRVITDPEQLARIRRQLQDQLFKGDFADQLSGGITDAIKQGFESGFDANWASNVVRRFNSIVLNELFRPFEEGLREALRRMIGAGAGMPGTPGVFGNPLGGLLGMLGLGGGGGGGGGYAGTYGGGLDAFNIYDSGGVVGVTAYGPKTKLGKPVIADSGFGPRHFPAMLEKGERVLTELMGGRTDAVMGGLTAAAQAQLRGAGGVALQVQVHNHNGSEVRTTRSQDGIRVDVMDQFAGAIGDPASPINRAIAQTFGLRPIGATR